MQANAQQERVQANAQQANVQEKTQQATQTEPEPERAQHAHFPRLDEVIQLNMGALGAAVQEGKPAALLLERALAQDPDAEVGLGALVRFLFGGGGPRHAQCELCWQFAAHPCIEATGAALALKTGLHAVGGRSVCLVCFRECGGVERLFGHYLTHAPAALRNVGLHPELALRLAAEKFPRNPQAEQRQTARLERSAIERWPQARAFTVSELLAHNPQADDGFTLLLLHSLGREALTVADEQDQEGLALRLSEPSRWYVVREGERWTPVFAGCEDEDAQGPPPPPALFADGTLAPGLSAAARVGFEVGALLALVAGGVWKRHALAHGDAVGRLLAPVSWHAVRQTLLDEGRGVLAQIFDQFFEGDYEAGLQELLAAVESNSWGFGRAWNTKDVPRAVQREQERAAQRERERAARAARPGNQ